MSPVTAEAERAIAEARPRCISHLVQQFGLSTEDAEDIYQVAFMRAAKHLGFCRFQGNSSVTTWFYKIAQNVALDHVRSFAAKMLSFDALCAGNSDEEAWREPKLGADSERIFQPVPPPFERLCESEHKVSIARAVESILSSLSARSRPVVERFYLRGEDSYTIARALGIPRATVLTRLHAARMSLRRKYATHRIDGIPLQSILSD